jgi:hypothetical protein
MRNKMPRQQRHSILKKKPSIQKLNNRVIEYMFSLHVKFYRAVNEETIQFFIQIAKPIVYVILNAMYILNWVYKKAIQFKLLSTAADKVKYYSEQTLRLLSYISVQFKSFVVNTLPIKVFVWMARVLPIGDWLKYEDASLTYGTSSLLCAIQDRDVNLVDNILRVCSEEALNKYLFTFNSLDLGPIQYAISHCEQDTIYLKKLLDAIKPEKRFWVLNKLSHQNENLIFSLIRSMHGDMHFKLVMKYLNPAEKMLFLNQISVYSGTTPVMYQAMDCEKWINIKAVLNYIPKDKLIDYLNIKNNRNDTFLTEAVKYSFTYYLENFIKLIPAKDRPAYFAKHNQGLKALLYAKANKHAAHQVSILKKYGVKLPDELNALTPDELKPKLKQIFAQLDEADLASSQPTTGLQVSEWVVRENFRVKHGQYPLAVLDIHKENPDLAEIKSAYRKMMLFSHPDKNNNSEESKLKSQLITEAYAVYTKPEVRNNYLKI